MSARHHRLRPPIADSDLKAFRGAPGALAEPDDDFLVERPLATTDAVTKTSAPRRAHAQSWDGDAVTLDGPPWYPPVKLAMDYALAALIAIVALPAVVVATVLVRLTSPGPVFYEQTRLGRGGRPFTIYKIRSMFHDCERLTGARWASPRDSRITRVGWYLRKLHVDELPQLLNVFKGEMSLIGPRPERPEFVPQLERAIPHYTARLLVRPGLTGLAQVQLPPDTDLHSVRRKLAYDLYYVKCLDPWMDLRILVATPLRVLGAPFRTVAWLFGIPSQEVIERAYRALATGSRPARARQASPAA